MNEYLWVDKRERLSLLLLLGFLFTAAVAGGSARLDDPPQLFIRLSAIVFGATGLARASAADLRTVRAPLVAALSIVALVVLQLVPLPPALWTALPGRAPFAVIAPLAGLGQVWRPLSLTPDLSLNALASLLPALALIILNATLRPRQQFAVAAALLLMIIISASLAFLQANGAAGNLYNYRVQGFPGPAGLLANRNHQALFLTFAFPLVALLLSVRRSLSRLQLAGIVTFSGFLLVMTLGTGSRAGVILAIVAIAAALPLHAMSARVEERTTRLGRSTLLVAAATIGIGLFAVTLVFARTGALQRLFSEDVSQEIRLKLFRPMLEIGMEYFPAGSGFGSFVDIFKMHERLEDLNFAYLNHAHNELLELMIEGGLPGLLIAGMIAAWALRRSLRAWQWRVRGDPTVVLARTGSVLLALAVLGSLADYPLRTPLISVVFAIAACWLAALPSRVRGIRPTQA